MHHQEIRSVPWRWLAPYSEVGLSTGGYNDLFKDTIGQVREFIRYGDDWFFHVNPGDEIEFCDLNTMEVYRTGKITRLRKIKLSDLEPEVIEQSSNKRIAEAMTDKKIETVHDIANFLSWQTGKEITLEDNTILVSILTESLGEG